MSKETYSYGKAEQKGVGGADKMWWLIYRSAKEENRKKQEDKKKNAPKKVQGPQGGAVKMGKAGGAVIQPGRSSAPGKKSAR